MTVSQSTSEPSPAGQDQQPLLQARHVSKRFGGFYAVSDVSFELQRGLITGLIGPNGAGKSTLFKVISGFLPATSGEVWFAGQQVNDRPVYEIARAGLVRTFQISRVFAQMTVRENLLLAAKDQRGESLFANFTRRGRVRDQEDSVQERADELIDYFSLGHLREAYAGSLSGGQRKLLAMARILMTQPRLILLDEPMAGVNPALKEQLLEYILDLRETRGLTFLVIEHDLDMIMKICDRVLAMATGELVASGTPDEVRRDPQVVDAYLGRKHS